MAALAASACWSGNVRAQAVVDTTLWVTDGPVYAVVRSGDTIYLGGEFTRVGPATGGGVPLGVASGQPVAPFPKVAGSVYAIAPDGSGGWYVGGDFTHVGGIARSNAAHVRADGSVGPWNPDANSMVSALAVSGGTVYAGGWCPPVSPEDPAPGRPA